MNGEKEKIFEIKNAKKSFGKTEVLKDISVSVENGDVLAIIGPSGSGKSTLLHIIGAMDRATEGEYLLDGVNVSSYSEKQLCRIRKEKVTFVFQNFALMDKYSAYENIELPLLHTKKSRAERKKLIREAAGKLKVEDQLNKKPKQMSGGQQQRIALARALVSGADIILADEPTGALDHATSMELMGLLKDYNKVGKTVIVVTHDKEVAQFADRVITIKDGEIA